VLVFSLFMRSMHERDLRDYVTGILLAFCRISVTVMTSYSFYCNCPRCSLGIQRIWISNWLRTAFLLSNKRKYEWFSALCVCALAAVLSHWNRCLGLQFILGETHVIPWCRRFKKAIIRSVFNVINFLLIWCDKIVKKSPKKHLVVRGLFACLN